jgi:hypothetical protein
MNFRYTKLKYCVKCAKYRFHIIQELSAHVYNLLYNS